MGDMADYYIDRMLDREWYPTSHRWHARRVVCQNCGLPGYWFNDKGKWVLMQNKVPHVCPPPKDLLEGFE